MTLRAVFFYHLLAKNLEQIFYPRICDCKEVCLEYKMFLKGSVVFPLTSVTTEALLWYCGFNNICRIPIVVDFVVKLIHQKMF